MALNQYMHSRNPFRYKKPNFKDLSCKYPEFRAHVTEDSKGKVHLDFKNPASLRALTLVLLKEEFGLDVRLPMDRLIPAVPQRLNYILWLEDLLAPPKGKGAVTGIDIGCGASCIYALLGAKKNGWNFLVTEPDATNLKFASENVERNGLQDKIEVVPVCRTSGLADLLSERAAAGQTFDFAMCNPPFFANYSELQGLDTWRGEERDDPWGTCTGSEGETVTEGGEVAFVSRLVEDSIKLGRSVRVYSSLLGRKCSLGPLRQLLRERGVTCSGSYELCQGRTMRWALAWSLCDDVTFPRSPFQLHQAERKPPLELQLSAEQSSGEAADKIRSLLQELEMEIEEENEGKVEGMMAQATAWQNTWSNQRRRKREQKRLLREQGLQGEKDVQAGDTACEAPKHKDPALEQTTGRAGNEGGTDVHVPRKRTLETDKEDASSQKKAKLSCSDDAALGQQSNKSSTAESKTEGANNSSHPAVVGNSCQRNADSSSDGVQSSEVSDQAAAGSNKKQDVEPVLSMRVDVTSSDGGPLLRLHYLGGSGRVVMQQVLQFVANRLAVPVVHRPKPQSHSKGRTRKGKS